MTDRLKSIIRDMGRLYDRYALIKATEKVQKRMEKENPEEYTVNGHYDSPEPEIFEVRRQFTKPHKWLPARSPKKVRFTTAFAVKNGKYLTVHKRENDNYHYQVFHIEEDGWNLLERSLFGILPKGLFLAWAEKNSKFYNIIIGFLGGIVIGGVGIVIAIIRK